jgi:hypothetical protein
MKTNDGPILVTRYAIRALLACVALSVAVPAAAQNYRFTVPKMDMEIFVQPDASVRVTYEIVFDNNRGARALDAVDVGLFHGKYDTRNMRATLDGRPLHGIRRSPYVDPGVEVPLGPHAIAAGRRGVFRFEATIPDMVYQDTTRDDYASLRVTPTWFGQQFVTGSTELKIAVHMPPGVEADEVLYQNQAFSGKGLFHGRVVAYWEFPNTRIVGPHMVGVSFPKRGMTHVITLSKWDLLVLWWEGNPQVQVGSGAALFILFAIFFFRFSGGTGVSFFVIVVSIVGFLFVSSPVFHLVAIPFFPVLFGLLWYPTRKGKRRRYLPPIASVEGGGIKRGLTAPEAAVLLELPIGRLVTLVVFGLMKKGVARMTNDEPLTVVVERDYIGERPARLEKAAENGVVLHAYEHAFLDVISKAPGSAVGDLDLSDALKGLIDHTVERVTAFDLKETRRYYEHIIKRAWAEAESLGEVDQRTKAVDKNFEWLLMDDGYRDGFSRWDRSGYRYRPIWIYGRVPGSGGLGSAAGGAARSSGPAFTPTFGDVAGSFAGWTENLAGQAASSIMPGSIGDKAGIVDFSGFDRGTGRFLEALASNSGGGGGGGGCACAGCACACACAGGGR